ncbi:MAG: hypothetical protein EXQ77_01445 [Thermoleophilia bacterium]|nr:hypothetical protein [Thermoleophilia bacterium]
MSALIDAVRAALDGADDADDALRGAVRALAAADGIRWAGIAFAEGTALVLGPAAGEPDPVRRVTVPVCFGDATVGELQVDGAIEVGVLEQVAALAAAYVLLGWDTDGEEWSP